jgi:hypothetical protein
MGFGLCGIGRVGMGVDNAKLVQYACLVAAFL